MSWFVTAIVAFGAIFLGFAMDQHKESLCEHNGLGEWHTWTQVCEPLRP